MRWLRHSRCELYPQTAGRALDRKSTRLNSSHLVISYAVFCLKKKNNTTRINCCAQDFKYPYRLFTSAVSLQDASSISETFVALAAFGLVFTGLSTCHAERLR